MKAVVIKEYGDASVLEYKEDVAIPAITSPKQVQVKLSHASVNPVDYKIRKGAMRFLMGVKFPYILGRDGCGVVTEVGSASKYKVGDKVMGLFAGNGAYAQYVVVDESDLCLRPDALNEKHASGLPLIGLTVWQMFENYPPFAEVMKKQEHGTLTDKRVLILGASGGTGTICTLLAKHYFGAHVYAVCSGKNGDYVKSLGADHIIDYTKEEWVDVVPKLEKERGTESKPFLDLVLDCAGAETSKKDADTLMCCTGAFVTIAAGANVEKPTVGSTLGMFGGIAWEKMKNMVGGAPAYIPLLTKTDGESLGRLVQFLLDNNLMDKIKIDNEFALSEIKEAHALIEKGRTVGKVIINIPE